MVGRSVSLHSHPGRWLPDLAGLGAALCPHNPLLDEVETDTYTDGLTCCCCPVQTRPGRNQWLLPLGCGLGLRLPHACSRPSGGPQMASNSEWSPQDMVARTGGLAVRPVAPQAVGSPGMQTLDTQRPSGGHGSPGLSEVGEQNWACPGSQGLVWPEWAAEPSNLGHASAE